MKNSIRNFGKCIVLASAAISLAACVFEPVPEAGPVYGAGPYGYATYPPYYSAYGYPGYGYPAVSLGYYASGHDGQSWHHWR